MDKLIEKFSDKKSIENLIIFLILLVIVFIVISSLTKSTEEVSNMDNELNVLQNSFINEDNTQNLEEKLAKILSMIKGAGEVNVMISYINEIEKVPMTDTKVTTTVISEKDSGGGERKTEETSTEESIIYEENSKLKTPVIKQSILPEVVGVIVVAEGAYDTTVKENLIKAVEATVNVPSHRIQVFSK